MPPFRSRRVKKMRLRAPTPTPPLPGGESSGGGEGCFDYAGVDAGEGPDVIDGGGFVQLVHGCVGEAEVDDRAERDQEAAVGGAAMSGEARADAGLGEDGGADDLVDRARGRQEGLAGDFRLDRRARRRLVG